MKSIITALLIAVTLPFTAHADRFDDLMASWSDNGNGGYDVIDAMRLAWVARPRVQALIDAYELTGDVTRMDKAHTAVDYWVNTTPQLNPMGEPAYVCLTVVENPGTETHGESFHIMYVIARFIRAVKTHPELSAYSDDADEYLAFLEDTMIPKWEKWVVDDSRQAVTGYHYPGAVNITQPTCTTCTTDPYTYHEQGAQHNKQAIFAEFALIMHDITGTQKYMDWARGVALELKSKLTLNMGPTGWYYSWNYWDPSWDKDFLNMDGTGAPRFGIWTEHKDGYNALTTHLAVECYLRGIVFCREDIQRFVRCNRDIMWDGITEAVDHDTWKLNDGSSATPTAYGGLNRSIAAFDTTGRLTDFMYSYYDTVASSWSTLNAPEFVRLAKAQLPPDTMQWVGPLLVIAADTVDIATVRFTFFNEVDPTSLDPANFDFSRDIVALSAVQDPVDKRIVTVTSTPQAPGRTIKCTISNVKDMYGNVTFPYTYGGNQPVEFVASGKAAGITLPRTDALRPTRLMQNANPVKAGSPVTLINTGAERMILDQNGKAVFTAGAAGTARWNGDAAGMYFAVSDGLVQKVIIIP